MAWQILNANYSGLLDLGAFDAALLMTGYHIVNTGGDAVAMSGSDQQLYAYGSLSASFSGIYTSGTSVHARIFVEPDSIVFGALAGVTLDGRYHEVYNYGTVSGAVDGIKARVVGTFHTDYLTNYGTITATNNGVSTEGGGAVNLKNFGTVTGNVNAYDASIGVVQDNITNSGVFNGNIRLGGGDDSYTALGAGKVIGAIFGGDGVDQFYVGKAAEQIDGGTGRDWIRLDTTTSFSKIALDHAFANSGFAAGDLYTGIENISGGGGADYFRGSADVNWLFGNGGADTLYGLAGDDYLTGGAGNDKLYGGAANDFVVGDAGKDLLSGGSGNDVFVYYTATEFGDTITDFANAAGNNDFFELDVDLVGFATSRLLTAAEFYKGTTNICTGAEDRIILRTTDNTVWLDTNGKAAGGLSMIADLQAGVTVTAADFYFANII